MCKHLKRKKLPTLVSFHSQWLPETKFLLPLFGELLKPVCCLRHICLVRGFSKQMNQRTHASAKKKNHSRTVLHLSLYSQLLPFWCANHTMLHLLFHCHVWDKGMKRVRRNFLSHLCGQNQCIKALQSFRCFIYIHIYICVCVYLVFIPRCSLSIQRIQMQVLKRVKKLNLQFRKSRQVHSHCYAKAEGTVWVK